MFRLHIRRSLPQAIVGMILVLATGMGMGAQVENSEFLVDVWTSDDGLPDSSITAITQTPDGYLWIGTLNGLARFDGVRFVHFDPVNTHALKHARIHGGGLFLGSDGTLWINTFDGSMTSLRKGVFKHEWQGGQVSAVFSQSNLTYFALLRGGLVCRDERADRSTNWQSVGLIGQTVGTTFRQDAGGNIWFVTRDGIVGRVNVTNCEAIRLEDYGLEGRRASYLSADRNGQIWVGTDKQIARWNGQQFENLTPTNGSPPNVTFLYCGDGSTCWVVADGVVRACRERQWYTESSAWRELASANWAFLGTHLDSKGRVWLRSFGQGLFHTTSDGDARRLTAAQGLPNDRVSCWFEDREGNIWLGVDHGGLVRLREKNFQVIGAAQGLAVPAISSVCEDQDRNIWFGTFGGGLYRFRQGQLDNFTLTSGANPKTFFCVSPATNHQLWVSAGNEDLYRFENGVQETPFPIHGVKAILLGRNGIVWLGRPGGLSRLVGTNWENFTASGEFERVEVRALAEDRLGRIWFGGRDGKLYQYDNGEFTTHRVGDDLEQQAIWSLLTDPDGTVWVGTFRGGLLRYKDGKFTRFTTQHGLPRDVICQILDDGMGRLWIGSDKGLFHVTKDALRNFDPEARAPSLPCVSYGLFDGLPTLEFTGNYQPTCWKGSDGRLWFATVKGLVSVRPDKISVNPQPPPVVIEEVKLDGKPLTAFTNGLPASLNLPPGKRQLDFHFTALSFAAPDKVRFRYRLTGFEDEWVEAKNGRSAHYGPLPPGQFRFDVVACNNDGVWSPEGASMNLRQLPQFWQTWWFQGLGAVTILGAIFGTVRFTTTRRLQRKLDQLKQQRAIERERERIAKDIHDDLGAGLTQILLQSSLARRESEGQVRTDLTQISDTARGLVRAMDEIVWAINPENDTLDGLASYLGKFVQDFVTSAGKRCRIIVPPELPPHPVSADARHNLYLAVKEALNNAAKHANATEICFQLNVQPSCLTFVIRDDGAGFDPDADKASTAENSRIDSGHGLRNIAQRLEAIGGRCTITSPPGKGTTVELNLPLQTRPTQNHEAH